MSQDSLLSDVKKAVVTWGGSLGRVYSDDHGAYAIRIRYRGQTFIAVAKQEPVRGLASFSQTIVKRAAHQDVLLAEFFGEEPTLGNVYVFDPVTVLETADESRGSSRKGVSVDWYELPLDHGVCLGDFVSGRAEPPRADEVAEEKTPSTLLDYA